MNFGYARVSTHDQAIQLQLDSLIKYCDEENIYTDVASGAKEDRPQLDALLNQLRKGDVVYVWRLDRLGRSLKHLITVVEDINDKGVDFGSLQEGFDTTTSRGQLIFHIFGALGEFERNLIREHTRSALNAARARGRKGGRKDSLSPKQIKTLRKMYDSQQHSIAEIGRTFKISRPTVYRYINKEA